MKKTLFTGIAATVLFIFAFLTWYKFHYSMELAESFEITPPEPIHRVLIATQGSAFKDAIVAGILDHLKHRNAYVKVIDVSALPQINENKWNAIIVLHTWENLKPQADSKAYLEHVKELNKVIVLATSGRGNYKIKGVNAISSASVMSDVSTRTLDIIHRLDAILDTNEIK